MRRRDLLALLCGAVALPSASHAKKRAAQPLVCGLMLPPLSTRLRLTEALRLGFEQNGLVVGGNLAFEMHSADGRRDRLSQTISSLLARNPAVIVTWGTEPIQAVLAQTHSVPVVMASIGDPVGAGVVLSLTQPGGNVTGFSLFLPETTGKRLQMLKQMLPALHSVTFLFNPANKSVELQYLATVSDAKIFGIEVLSGLARQADDIDQVIAFAARSGSDAILASDDQLFTSERVRIINAAMRARLPVVSSLREFTDAGGLFTYGSSITDTSRRAAGYVDKILKGAKPGDLPIQQPTKFELIVNLKTANALQIELPPAILALADEVIE
jgi:putative tryptophan/tyrosine transport system substrate-binding protein